MVIQISVGIIAVAFAVLAVYLIITLKAAKQSIERVDRTLQDLTVKLDVLSKETVVVLQHTQEITADVQQKMKSLDGLFQSVSHVGEAANQVSSSMKQVSATVSQSLSKKVIRPVEQNRKTIEDVGNWLLTGIQLWKSLKSYKRKGEHSHDGTQP